MILLKLFFCGIVLFLIPEWLGLFILRKTEEKENVFLAFVVGYLFEFASFEVLYVPMYFLQCSFQTVAYSWIVVIFLLTIVSIWVNRKRGNEILQATLHGIKNMPKFILIFLIIVAIQIYFPVRYRQQIDPDDAFYLATVTTTLETNSLFKINAYDGTEYEENMLRYSMSGLAIWFASLSKLLSIHPAILQHTIWPIVAILLEMTIYGLLGNQLVKKDKEKLTYFLILLSMVYAFGFFSVYTNFSFFAYRSWQGKALIANLVVPATWLFYLKCVENDKNLVNWFVFVLTMISACFVTEMGVFLIPVEVAVLSFISLCQERKILNFIKTCACCAPQLLVGLIYLIFQ